MDANEAAGEETRRKLQKNVEISIKQVLATTPHETPTIRTLAPITKTIQVRRTRHAGHCWRSKDELISDVLLWTPTYGCARVGRPARTYIQQLCEDTGCNPEDLPEVMNDREKWRERVRDIRAGDATWWWWWWLILLALILIKPRRLIRRFTNKQNQICSRGLSGIFCPMSTRCMVLIFPPISISSCLIPNHWWLFLVGQQKNPLDDNFFIFFIIIN